MKKLTLNCPYASYDARMRINCSKTNMLCGHQAWKPCKGWSEMTAAAADCTLREEKKNERKRTTVKKRTD